MLYGRPRQRKLSALPERCLSVLQIANLPHVRLEFVTPSGAVHSRLFMIDTGAGGCDIMFHGRAVQELGLIDTSDGGKDKVRALVVTCILALFILVFSLLGMVFLPHTCISLASCCKVDGCAILRHDTWCMRVYSLEVY